ncbi:tetratricopeptide repeat protein [Methylomicrobium lacus]|uniref:tetratricopeptide repeat protein n=1 Tax=Methylomicrobium lacus TaxID=136992 RepID=UPI0035A87211
MLLFLLAPLAVEAASLCTQPVAKVVSLQGKVTRQSPGNPAWAQVHADDSFCPGETLRTQKWSRATLVLSNESLITLDQGSTLIFSEPKKESSPWLLKLLEGVSYFRSRQPQRLDVQTPFINAVHEGTEFLVTVDSRQAQIAVFDGQVAATNAAGRIHIKKGYVGSASQNQPPRLQALTVAPTDAVQWALFYPPLIDYQHYATPADPVLASALAAYRQGDVQQALTLLDGVSIDAQHADVAALKASLLLTVGRVDEASASIDQAQRLHHDPSTLYALQAVIAVAKNRQDTALELAHKAESLDPKSSVAKIALSYAYQSLFKIEEALSATQQATQLAPEDALAWARLAELQLSTGHRDEALLAAQKAEQLNPQLARTKTVLGFADLAQVDTAAAKRAFEQALALDSSDPIARLGLGLAKIRKGALQEGTRELETAVNLAPTDAVSRSYLGKAYYELRNKDYAGTELNLAKEMDPKDPTPWFYDAILKQTINRPVEALHDMQKAIELNDNRGVYRSRLLLDSDSAARSASLGRIYNDLGFQQRGLLEGWNSINQDPGNYSAHRLLSDNYAALPRHEVSRLSELLKAQLLQPINITPVQPQAAESNILILDSLGPQITSFNEYNPLFTRNRLALQASGFYGSHDTWSDEAVQSGVWDRFSYSLGQFHYHTDGYRENNAQKKDIYNFFAQAAVTTNANVQVELRRSEDEFGDINQGFFRDQFSLINHGQNESNSIRGGFHYEFNENSNLLASIVHREENFSGIEEIFPGTHLNFSRKVEGTQYELQHLYLNEHFDLTSGINYISDQNQNQNLDFSSVDNFFFQALNLNAKSEHKAFYLYANTKVIPNFLITTGVSQDFYQIKKPNDLSSLTPDYSSNPLNPKFGVTWNPTKSTTFRFAAFRSLKRGIIQKQTLEPTQIAGFNQFFDDIDGAIARRIGFGLDHRLNARLFAGAEVSRRYIETPFITIFSPTFDKTRWNEKNARTYINWTSNEFVSLGAEYNYEKLNRNNNFFDTANNNSNFFTDLETHRAQVFGNLYHPSGFQSKLSLSYVNQSGLFTSKLDGTESFASSRFWLLDTEIGYRLPRRHGLAALGIKNLLDEKFNFQGTDVNYPSFPQGRFLFSRLTLSF